MLAPGAGGGSACAAVALWSGERGPKGRHGVTESGYQHGNDARDGAVNGDAATLWPRVAEEAAPRPWRAHLRPLAEARALCRLLFAVGRGDARNRESFFGELDQRTLRRPARTGMAAAAAGGARRHGARRRGGKRARDGTRRRTAAGLRGRTGTRCESGAARFRPAPVVRPFRRRAQQHPRRQRRAPHGDGRAAAVQSAFPLLGHRAGQGRTCSRRLRRILPRRTRPRTSS